MKNNTSKQTITADPYIAALTQFIADDLSTQPQIVDKASDSFESFANNESVRDAIQGRFKQILHSHENLIIRFYRDEDFRNTISLAMANRLHNSWQMLEAA